MGGVDAYKEKKKSMQYNLKTQLEFHIGSLFCSLERNDFHTSCLWLDKKTRSDSSIQRMNSPRTEGGKSAISLTPGVEM